MRKVIALMTAVIRDVLPPAFARLDALAPLAPDDVAALAAAAKYPRHIPARRELLAEGDRLTHPFLVLSGWAALTRTLADGRRQVLGLLLPGDLLFGYGQPQPLVPFTILALTDLATCTAPPARADSGLAAAYATSRALDQRYLLNQVMRLGRKSAFERIADLLLELCERLDRAGLVTNGLLPFPITQELLGDALGLTSVHVNRTLQALRRQNMLTTKDRSVRLHDPRALAQLVDYQSAIVSAAG